MYNIFTVITVTFQLWKYYTSKYLFNIEIYQSAILNSDIIATEIDIENSEHLIYQII